MSEFGILATAAAGMDAQRFALDVAARNVAAAEVADPGHPFARLVPQFATPSGGGADAAGDADVADVADDADGADGPYGVAGGNGADVPYGVAGGNGAAGLAVAGDADGADADDGADAGAAGGYGGYAGGAGAGATWLGGGTVRAIGTRTLAGVDVDAVTEMVAVLNAQRAYEADASVFDAGKRLAERTIDMGRL